MLLKQLKDYTEISESLPAPKFGEKLHLLNLGLVARNTVCGVSDKARLKAVSSATETS